MPHVSYFYQSGLPIFRGNNTENAFGRAIYVMNFDVGQVTPLNYALATMFEVLFEKELKLRLCVASEVALSARTRSVLVSDHIIL